ncbi:MAG: class I SAM-dependent methyltransferase [Planctomycetia bacterium]|nr:class I SAM-dependent methyltransferase [Planctomycetia bacterium]
MDRTSLATLLTSNGQTILAEAMALAPDETTFLACFTKLEKRASRELARTAVETAMLRRRATVKFSQALSMYFTREALEQATSEPVARHRARRFHGRVLEIGCGIGGDTLALAGVASVTAVDLDGLRLDMARTNVAAYGTTAEFVEGDALTLAPACDAVFVDPDRRVGGRRQLSVEACEPTLSAVRQHFAGRPLAAKLAPGVPIHELRTYDGELEFVSLDGELKECVLWIGSWATARVRATVLPTGETLAGDCSTEPPPPDAVGAWLIDPDPAVIRAGLVGDLAARLHAWPLDASVAYLTADAWEPTPFARAWPVRDAMPLHLNTLRDHLRTAGVGRVNVLRRGVPLDPDDLIRRLKLKGHGVANLVLTPHEGRPWAIICEA